MANPIRMPMPGQMTEECTVLQWYKAPGFQRFAIDDGSAAGGKWDPAQMHDYIGQTAVPQVEELLTSCGSDMPAIIWWDAPNDMNYVRAEKLYDTVESLRSDIIINNRRCGGYEGDTSAPEQTVFRPKAFPAATGNPA